jgi:hypothetical protein
VRYIHVIGYVSAHISSPLAKPAFLQAVSAIFAEITQQLAPLWLGLTEWLALIYKEIVWHLFLFLPFQPLQTHDAPNENSVSSSIHAAIADTRRWSFKSDLSTPSGISRQQLLSTRVADTVSTFEIELTLPYVQPVSVGIDGEEDPLAAEGDASALHDAVSEEILQVQALRSPTTQSEDQKSLNSLRKSRSTTRIGHITSPSIRSRLSSEDVSVSENPSLRDAQIPAVDNVATEAPPPTLLEQYMDRLSAIIRGFHLIEQIGKYDKYDSSNQRSVF